MEPIVYYLWCCFNGVPFVKTSDCIESSIVIQIETGENLVLKRRAYKCEKGYESNVYCNEEDLKVMELFMISQRKHGDLL